MNRRKKILVICFLTFEINDPFFFSSTIYTLKHYSSAAKQHLERSVWKQKKSGFQKFVIYYRTQREYIRF